MKNFIAVWSEFTPYSELHNSIDELIKCESVLFLAVHQRNYKDPDLYQFLLKARHNNLEVRLWPLMDKDKGYWPNKWNIEAYSDYVIDLIRVCESYEIKPSWLIFDVEPHHDLLLEVERLFQNHKWLKGKKLIRTWGEKIDWKTAHLKMKTLVDLLHAMDIQIQVVTMPMVLDDLLLGKQKLQHLLGLPIEGIDWDEITFMLYRPYFWDYLPGVTAQIVGHYSADAFSFFGKKASVALGPIGSPGMTKSKHYYKKSDQLFEDIRSAKKQGISRFSFFSLEGIQEQGELSRFVTEVPLGNNEKLDLRSVLIRKSLAIGIKYFL